MTTIIVYNRGKRNYHNIKNSKGEMVVLEREGFVEMEEVAGLKLIAAYPRDLTSSKIAGPSSESLNRREQSLRDREKVLAQREAKIAEKEKSLGITPDKPKAKRGRPKKETADDALYEPVGEEPAEVE